MPYRQHVEFHWRASNNTTKVATIHTLSNPAADLGGAAGVIAASQAVSAAVLEVAKAVPVVVVGGSYGSSPYSSCHDYVKLQFRSADDELVDFHVPAPLPGILTGAGLGDVDPANPLVADLIAAVMTGCASSSGSALVSFVQGGRYRVDGRRLF